MQIEFELPARSDRPSFHTATEPEAPILRAPRLARILALAHKIDADVRSGEIGSYREAALLARICSARLSQILQLVNLAPDIQEYILFATSRQVRALSEHDLRQVACEHNWRRQRAMFANFRKNEVDSERRQSDHM